MDKYRVLLIRDALEGGKAPFLTLSNGQTNCQIDVGFSWLFPVQRLERAFGVFYLIHEQFIRSN